MTFNVTKTKLLSFNHHGDPLFMPVKMNGIELQKRLVFIFLA